MPARSNWARAICRIVLTAASASLILPNIVAAKSVVRYDFSGFVLLDSPPSLAEQSSQPSMTNVADPNFTAALSKDVAMNPRLRAIYHPAHDGVRPSLPSLPLFVPPSTTYYVSTTYLLTYLLTVVGLFID